MDRISLSLVFKNKEMVNERVSKMEGLTKKEMGVLDQLLQGKSNREIAVSLNISEKTVEKHLTSVYQKLGVSGRAEAITFYYRNLLQAGGKK